MRKLLIAPLVLALIVVGCQPASESATRGPQVDVATTPQRPLVIAIRGEPPSLASKPVVDFSGSLNRPRELFNANLDYLDEREVAHPMLAEALPELNTDTWRVF